eukprot:CAMPEP_0181306638 /NCGR_PEP_ID=MMETSP1101-20121128/10415_1 /TAXON_ID=46948 /ORGANISM="Rhodomonas abbreviata, Strain Caron Lab Isolate" /LENGTH=829 /DNA_ID=CAMNT_0023412725 /DNA_START=205 /DNA_END=2692 /DNA_ORIENTATION=+
MAHRAGTGAVLRAIPSVLRAIPSLEILRNEEKTYDHPRRKKTDSTWNDLTSAKIELPKPMPKPMQSLVAAEESPVLELSSTFSEVLGTASSEHCTDFLTELEWEASLAEGCNQEEQSRSVNATHLHFPSLQEEGNSGVPALGDAQHERGDITVPVSVSARPPVVLTGAAVFTSAAVLEPHASMSLPAISISKYLWSLVPHVLIFTQRPFNFLERSIEREKRKLVEQTISVVFHSSVPLDILLHRRFVAVIVLLIAALQGFFAVDSCIQKLSGVEGKAFRFSPLELKSGATDIDQPNIAGFGLFTANLGTNKGCLSHIRPASSYTEGKHLVALFDTPVPLDGFSLTTSGPPANDPVRFTVSVQREDGRWEEVAFQQNLVTFSGERRPGAAVELPECRGEATLFDLRAARDLPWFVGRVVGGISICLGLAVLGGSGLPLVGVRVVGRRGLYGCWAAGGLAMVVAGVLYALLGKRQEAVMWLVYGGVFLTGTAAVFRRERSLIPILLCFGVGILVADALCHGVVVGRGAADVAVPACHAVLACFMLLGWLVLWLKSLVQHREVTKVLAADKAAYLDAWRELCSQAGADQALRRLERVVASASVAVKHGAVPAQCQRIMLDKGRVVREDGQAEWSLRAQWLWWLRNAWSTLIYDVPHHNVHLKPVRSLDTIYSQATCLHPILRGKVQEWAGKTGAMLATLDGGFVRWDEARGSAEQRRRVKWGQIKKEGRAAEKAIRCYGEDVSRLVDVCRQTLVFETVGSLADCLQEIANDTGVELVRVKNRLSPEEDGAASAGFRNVNVNLRLVGEDARSFGVDTHVCELQLLLRDFAVLQ